MTANNSFGGACTDLPIQLLSFAGVCVVQTVLLNWSTAMEINNKSFTVQRSVDGMNWQRIGTIDGAGSSTALHSYSFTDKQPANSVSYYRLMLTAFDGENTYSIIITVGKCGMDTAKSFTLYPNPSTGTFTLSYIGDRTLVSSIEIFNSAGDASVWITRVSVNSRFIQQTIG